jgi:flagellar hook-associated protein 1 FlgK
VEPSDSGIASLMNRMWGAWSDLSNNPDSAAAKAAVVEFSSSVADALQLCSAQLAEIRQETVQGIGLATVEANGWLAELADLNVEVARVEAMGDHANDLRDRRDLVLDQLSHVVSVSYAEQADGTVSVWLDSARTRALVDGQASYELGGGGQTLTAEEEALVQGGQLKGLLDMRDGALDPARAGSLADRLAVLGTALIRRSTACTEASRSLLARTLPT